MIKPITYHGSRLSSNSLGGNQSSLGLECSKSCQEEKLPIKEKPSHNSVCNRFWKLILLAIYNNDTNSKYAPSLAAVTSLVSRAMTLQAASCWYRACDSSWRVVCSCCRRVKLWSITASCKTKTMDQWRTILSNWKWILLLNLKQNNGIQSRKFKYPNDIEV